MISQRAILFDCNGIIVDDEPIHLKLFQKVLLEEGISLSKKEYFKRYLAMDDKSCFRDVLKRYNRKVNPKVIRSLVKRKAIYYQKTIKKELRIFPGVKTFAKAAKSIVPLAIVSGALRHEIKWILKKSKLNKLYSVIVSSEDVKNGKPHPECYLKGLKRLNKLPQFKKSPLKARECTAIEDSIHGVLAAKRAGMNCIAVTNSYPRRKLKKANFIVSSLVGFNFEKLFRV